MASVRAARELLWMREPRPAAPRWSQHWPRLTFSMAFDPKHLIPAKGIRCVWAILLPHWAAQQAEAGQCWVQAWPGTPLHFPWLSHPLDSMASVDLAGQPLPGLNTARYQKDLHSQGSCFLFHNTSSVISQMEFAQQSSLALTLYPVCDSTPFHCQNTP